jgi:hypothetical protein
LVRRLAFSPVVDISRIVYPWSALLTWEVEANMPRPISMFISTVLALAAVVAGAQEPKTAPQQPPRPQASQEQRKFVSPSQRLTAAKTALVRSAGGSEIPSDVISSAVASWGRFTRVDSPEKADIILEVTSPGDEGGGVSVSSSVNRSRLTGRDEQSTTSSRQLSNAPIRLIVYDARSHVALWSAQEQPKFAMKQKSREDNLVQAAQRLFNKFRDRLEAPAPQ